MSSSGEQVQSPGGFARGGTVFRGLQPSEARLRRAKRGRPAERSEAPPSEARLHPPRLRRAKRGRAKVIGRSPLQKNSKRFHQKAQGNHLLVFFQKTGVPKNVRKRPRYFSYIYHIYRYIVSPGTDGGPRGAEKVVGGPKNEVTHLRIEKKRHPNPR